MTKHEPALDPSALWRTARKAWRCIAADEFRRYAVTGTKPVAADSRVISTTNYTHTLETAHAKQAQMSQRFREVVIEPQPNPEYRDNCLGAILPGERYVEYVGEAFAFQSGIRYCRVCGTAVWARTS